MREVVYDYKEHPEKILEIPGIGITTIDDALEILKDYWIFLEYNNVKRDGNNVEGALETPINVELRKAGITPFSTRKMTGDETFQDVREVLSQVETNEDVFNIAVTLVHAVGRIVTLEHGLLVALRGNVIIAFALCHRPLDRLSFAWNSTLKCNVGVTSLQIKHDLSRVKINAESHAGYKVRDIFCLDKIGNLLFQCLLELDTAVVILVHSEREVLRAMSGKGASFHGCSPSPSAY